MDSLGGIAPELRLSNLRTQDYPGGLVKTQIAAPSPLQVLIGMWDWPEDFHLREASGSVAAVEPGPPLWNCCPGAQCWAVLHGDADPCTAFSISASVFLSVKCYHISGFQSFEASFVPNYMLSETPKIQKKQ